MKNIFSFLTIFLLSLSLVYQSPSTVDAANGSERVKGDNRYETAIAISKKGWPNGLETSEKAVVLARADNPADALASASLAGVKDAPILLTSTNSLPSSVHNELKRLGAEKVYALGGTNAISNGVISDLKVKGYSVERVSGKNRFETASAINEEAGTNNNSEAILVNGLTVADALSASSNSAINEVPIYLSTKDKIPASLPSNIDKVTIYGGTGVVSPSIETSLKQKGITVERISGKNRYTTNIQAAKELNTSSDDFILVRGTSVSKSTEDYPDAVAASGLANKLGMDIVLSHPTSTILETKEYLSTVDGKAVILGGTNAISQKVVTNLLTIGDMKVHFIYVGQGDSTLIQTPNGKNILIDAGKRSAGDDVICYLEDHGVESLDMVVATHPDADHIGGLIDVMNEFPVKQVIDSGKSHTSQTYMDYLNLVDQKDIPFDVPEVGSYLNVDPLVDIQVLNNGDGYSDNNNASVALKVSYGENDYLLTGDAAAEAEMNMVQNFDLQSEVYKVGHHGSDSSSTQVFLDEVSPDFAVISAGIDNQYGHPDSEVINRLKRAGVSDYMIWELNGEDVVFTNKGDSSLSASSSPSACGTDEPTPEPDPEPDPEPTTGKLDITNLDLDAETVKIKNIDNRDISMDGWRLVSVDGNQTFNFPSDYTLKEGASVTVTSGRSSYENRPSVLQWSRAYLWDNNGDTARLYDPQGGLIDEFKR
ncbi:cell wall-binding repeat-containing protein [Halobacillus sp. HZG1]|uniref:cell wall-binding repeat-containing protein n=1 Tax=Halobacillus sp. HZG1 TaxID=3111769 RepID=UPI002DBF01E8|nr:cell wall-binding repeat-containing protein [Halobacillus sp. HZG1]MEC3884616.1 cell wall-binding repeat-containing protein [Halobacillus sp. HZG1]